MLGTFFLSLYLVSSEVLYHLLSETSSKLYLDSVSFSVFLMHSHFVTVFFISSTHCEAEFLGAENAEH